MKWLAPLLVLASAISWNTLEGQTMVITRSGSRPAQPGPSATFTGSVRVTPLFDANDNIRASSASVSFEAGARSAWHTHPKGQLLIVTAGTGRIQQKGGGVEEIRAGDTIWTPPGVQHWHGASPASPMTHLAIQEALGGKAVEWLAKVTDAEYNAATPAAAGRTAAAAPGAVPSDAQKAFGDIAPALAQYTDEVLFGDVWRRPGLSPRDRSLVTVAALVAGYRTNELPFHMKRALDHGVTRDELIASARSSQQGSTTKTMEQEESRMWMTVGERRFAITLSDNAAARAFAAQLPLTLEMSELNGNEKHAELPKALPADASRPGTIRNGDLMLYGTNTLVVFYSTFQSSYSYTRLGRVDDPSDLPTALGPRGVRVVFSRD
jgi:4-carboxymuconolactone decarboxylase